MRRRLFTIIAAISLLLCLATVAIWVRSWSLNAYSFSTVSSYVGSDYYEWTTRDGRRWHIRANPDGIIAFQFLGRQLFHIPYWPIILLTAILPLVRLNQYVRKVVQRRSTERGVCPRCGYDLRATPDRCPECGLVAATVE